MTAHIPPTVDNTTNAAIPTESDRAIAVTLTDHANVIRKLSNRVVSDIVEIGRRLTVSKKLCGHGNWLPWLDKELGWSEDVAEKYMRIAKSPYSATARNFVLPVDSLYLLAKPNTPDEVRQEVVARSENGERLSVSDVKQLIDEARDKIAPAPDEPEDLRRSRSAKKPQPPKSQARKALYEFKVTVDIFFSKMDYDAKREAIEYVIAKGAAFGEVGA